MIDWIEKLKIGDSVIMNDGVIVSLVTVSRFTSTLVCFKETRVRMKRADGIISGGFQVPTGVTFSEATPNQVRKIKRGLKT